MICYRDKTWCAFYKECKKGNKCTIALTPEVIKLAKEWWRNENPPICTYVNKPDCFENA
jgi:hypothetical protein